MARTVLTHPFDTMSGKLTRTDKVILRTRNGQTHAYVVQHPYEDPVAPARNQTANGQTHYAAEQTAAGFRFTVTGLSESTHYTFGMTVKDANNATLQTYTGEFTTTGTATAVDNTSTEPTARKIIRDGQVYILRGDKIYTPMGVEVNE